MPDANKENTLNQLVGAAFGAAGQRCMALSTAILVGEAKKWLPELVERAKKLRVNAGNQLLDFASLALSPGFCIAISPESLRMKAIWHGKQQRFFMRIRNFKQPVWKSAL